MPIDPDKRPADDDTVGDARDWLRDKAKHEKGGAHCPVCTQRAKVYDRRIGVPMARVLIAMYHADRRAPGEYVRITDVRYSLGLRGAGDDTKLRYWGLIEAPPKGRRPDGSPRVGLWRITEAGRAFVLGSAVHRSSFVFDDRLLGHGDSGVMVTIRDALGEKFDYDDLMNPAYLDAPDDE